MKRSWMGFGLLLVLLLLSILSTWAMVRIHDPIEADLNRAAQRALLENWEDTGRFFRRAKTRWEDWENLRACLADHTPIEEIDAGFALLEVYFEARDDIAFAAASRQLARQTAAVGEAHELVWWNLF